MLKKLSGELAKAGGDDLRKQFMLARDYLNLLNSVTHSGMEALDLRISEDYVVGGPYPEDQVAQLIRESTRVAVYAGTFDLMRFGYKDSAIGTVELFNEKFAESVP